jgi:hypothetical protein
LRSASAVVVVDDDDALPSFASPTLVVITDHPSSCESHTIHCVFKKSAIPPASLFSSLFSSLSLSCALRMRGTIQVSTRLSIDRSRESARENADVYPDGSSCRLLSTPAAATVRSERNNITISSVHHRVCTSVRSLSMSSGQMLPAAAAARASASVSASSTANCSHNFFSNAWCS